MRSRYYIYLALFAMLAGGYVLGLATGYSLWGTG